MVLILVAHVPVIGVDIWEHVSCSLTLRLNRGAHVFAQAFYLQARSQILFSSDPDTNSVFSSQYQNVKADVRIPNSLLTTCLILFQYLNAIWSVINFKEAEKRFVEASG
jgi:hypothetical protein